MKKKLLFAASFFVGGLAFAQNQLSNNSFEQWNLDSVQTLDQYQSAADEGRTSTYPSTDSYLNSYSCVLETQLTSQGDTSVGYFINFDFNSQAGGAPYSNIPDSLCGYYKVNIVNQDTAWIMAMFTNNGSMVGAVQIPIAAANNTSTWQRFSFPIMSFGQPDTLKLAAVSSNYLGSDLSVIEPGSMIMLDSVYIKNATGGLDPIPNYDFENWTTKYKESPVNFSSSVAWEPYGAPQYSVEKSTDATDGNYAVKLNNIINQRGDTVQGNITTGDQQNYGQGGSPFTYQPLYVTFDYKAMRVGNDTASVNIEFKNGGTGYYWSGKQYFTNVANYTADTIYFTGLSQTPDTLIFNVWNGRIPGSWFMIDNVKFHYPATTSTITTAACGSYTSPSGNYTWTSSGTYTDTLYGANYLGGDSIITVNLTINANATGVDVQTACGSFTWIDGNTYTSSTNTPTYTFANGAANGCDSIVTLNLTINQPATGTDVQTACGSFTWIDGNTYTASTNTPTYTIPNGAANGCDSIVTLDLTITNVDVSTTVNSNTISANQNGATYQWLDCNNNFAPISGETSQSFTATANGDYAVEVTYNNCTDTSACVNITGIGIGELSNKLVKVYPNPLQDNIVVELANNANNVKITIFTAEGKVIYNQSEVKRNKINIDASSWSKGIYYLQIHSSNGLQTVKLIK